MKGANVMVACSKVTAMRPIRKDCSVRKALCVFSAVLSIAATRSQAQDLPCRSDSSLLDSAETASALNDAYASLLDESSLESAHSGLALQAAWEELKQSMPLRPASPVRSRRIGMNKLNRVALARFIGFVEGRLQVKVPDWWEEHLSVAKGKLDEITGLLFLSIPDRGSAPYSVHSATSVPEGIDLKEIDVCVRGNVDVGVEIGRDDIIVHLEEFPLRLDRPPLGTFYVSARRYGPSQCLLLVSGELPRGELCAVDLKEQKLLWKQQLWCSLAPYFSTGAGFFHWSETLKRQQSVIVFGMCDDVVYIEGFDYVSGTPLFRFSSLYGWSRARLSGSSKKQ